MDEMRTRRTRIRWQMGGLLLAFSLCCPAPAQQDCSPISGTTQLLLVEYEEDLQPIFDVHCVACHQPGGEGFEATGLDLRPGVSYDHLVGIASSQNSDLILVDPFNGDGSLLWHKINCNDPPVGERMPKGAPPLDPDSQQRLFVDWIVNGARRTLREPPTESMPINFGMSGSWYERGISGQGFVFDVVEGRDPPLFVAYWFAFTEDAGGPDAQRWYFADGSFEPGDSSVVLDVYMLIGGRLGHGLPVPLMEVVGELTVSFQNCTEAILSYRIDMDGEPSRPAAGSFDIERLSPDVMCESLSESE